MLPLATVADRSGPRRTPKLGPIRGPLGHGNATTSRSSPRVPPPRWRYGNRRPPAPLPEDEFTAMSQEDWKLSSATLVWLGALLIAVGLGIALGLHGHFPRRFGVYLAAVAFAAGLAF